MKPCMPVLSVDKELVSYRRPAWEQDDAAFSVIWSLDACRFICHYYCN
ncbi:hypothetical protein [Rheinheimera sp.]